jgi:hypothetical protein
MFSEISNRKYELRNGIAYYFSYDELENKKVWAMDEEWEKSIIDLFNNLLNSSVIVYDATNQSHPRRMSITTMPTIRIRHAFICFYFSVDMFNNNPPSGKSFVIRLFLFAQLVFLACLYWYEAVPMVCSYPKISKIGVKRY